TGSTGLSLFMAVAMVVAGFLFSAVAAYMAGLVGSSNNPISAVTIVTLLFTSLLLLALGASGAGGIAAALGVGAVIATAAAIGGDNLQDLKTGHVVGATPWKQQVAIAAGGLTFAFIAGIVLDLLHRAFVIGSDTLPAPQANLMAIILDGIFQGSLDQKLLFLGMVIGAGIALLRLPILPIAVGMYLPFGTDAAMFLGGLLRHVAETVFGSRAPDASPEVRGRFERNGTLFASGIIAGEAVMGVLVALVIVAAGSSAPSVPGLSAAEAQTAHIANSMGRLAPAVVGVLVGAAWLVLSTRGRALSRAARFVVPALVGLGVTLWMFAADATYAYAPRFNWPGFLVFAYIALLMVYFPLREVLVGPPQRRMRDGSGAGAAK
ncbi:MAG: OPT/YSL family transporter, partial [Methanobacteriota archaeon]